MSLIKNQIISPKSLDWETKWMNDPRVIFWVREFVSPETLIGKFADVLAGYHIPESYIDVNSDGVRRGVKTTYHQLSGYYQRRLATWADVSSTGMKYYANTGEITVLFWAKHDSDITSTSMIVCYGNYGEGMEDNLHYEVYITNKNEVRMLWEKGSGTNINTSFDDDTFLIDGDYHFYSLKRIKSGSQCYVELRRDLNLIATSSLLDLPNGGWMGWISLGNFCWTSDPGVGNGYGFPGYFGNVFIYDGVFPYLEEKAFYNFTKGIYA